MATTIRLMRTGAHKSAKYRIVAKDSRTKRDGRFIEILGHYDPGQNPPEVVIKEEPLKARLAHGATMSSTVKSLVKKAGIQI